ncbi:hypothetical protein MBLNU459_g6405t1 [Dothideomycetes sp. NU459]
MPLHIGLPYGQRNHEAQEAARDARRQLAARVRADWDYPDAPHPDTHTSGDAKAAVNAHVDSSTNAANAAAAAALDFVPAAWKERQYSDIESSGDEASAPSPSTPRKNGRTARPRFESPDAVSAAEAERRAGRKRKRQAMLDEELGWNVGLAHFSARRNAWTGARSAANAPRGDAMSDRGGGGGSSSRSSLSSAAPSSLRSSEKELYTTPAGAEDVTVVLPVAPPLLPDHPVRNRINPSSYAEIYSKVILQARTPTVPINLQDCTNALVYGWKEEGNWPPKDTQPEPSMAKKKAVTASPKHPHLKKSVQVVSKVFGLSSPASSNSHG